MIGLTVCSGCGQWQQTIHVNGQPRAVVCTPWRLTAAEYLLLVWLLRAQAGRTALAEAA